MLGLLLGHARGRRGYRELKTPHRSREPIRADLPSVLALPAQGGGGALLALRRLCRRNVKEASEKFFAKPGDFFSEGLRATNLDKLASTEPARGFGRD